MATPVALHCGAGRRKVAGKQWMAVAGVDEKRFIDIETKLAHQEHLVAELNDVLTGQQAQLTRLDKLCASLDERVRSLADAAPPIADVDERPPHY